MTTSTLPKPASKDAARPSDLAIIAVMMLAAREWMHADGIRGGLKRLGFTPSTQQVAAWLRRMEREEMPCVESCQKWEEYVREYRLTRFGWTLAGNTWRFAHALERASKDAR